jgi:Fe-S oxidoreductase
MGRRLNVPTLNQIPDPEILWWVGCAPATDAAPKNSRAFAEVLNAAGVEFAVLGAMEQCSGFLAEQATNSCSMKWLLPMLKC